MGRIYDSVVDLTGATPLVRLNRLEQEGGLAAALYAKLEFLNPTRSSRDRAVKEIISEALKGQLITAGTTVIAVTTGNTGVALGQWSKLYGFKVIAVVPGRPSQEQRKLLGGYAVRIVPVPASAGYEGALAKARKLAEGIGGAVVFNDLSDTLNADAHYRTTGPEILEDLDGKADIIIAPAKFGDTVSGAGRFIKEHVPSAQTVAVSFVENEPDLNKESVDEIVRIDEKLAREFSSKTARTEGILAGVSSGAVIAAAYVLAQRPENAGKNIVALLPDTGERYLSTGAYGDVLVPPEPF